MKAGTEVKCMTDQDMIEFTRWIQKRGGEVFCKDYEMKVIKVIRGTENAEKVELFNVDGVLGAVNTDDSKREEAEQKRRCELFRAPEGDLLQLGYEQDLRTR